VNRPIKKVAIFCFALFAVLFLDGNWIQVVKASSYSAHADNYRNTIYNYQVDRGNIIVGSTNVASSTATKSSQMKYQRVYSNGPEYAPVTGYFSSNYGTSNLEQFENELLDGKDTRLATQNFLRKAEGKDTAGGSVVTTINSAVQDAAYSALKQELTSAGQGAVAALDPKTGAILGLVSLPSYDPNQLASSSTTVQNDYATQLNNSRLQPKLDQALNQTYPPGSTFKIITSTAALEKGVVSLDEEFEITDGINVGGRFIENANGEYCGGTFRQAFAESCNSDFLPLGPKIGSAKMVETAEKFGFNAEPPLYAPSIVKEIEPAESSIPKEIGEEVELAVSAIGQGEVLATPLQMASVAQTIANDGVRMPTSVVQNKKLRPTMKPVRVMKKKTAEELTELMIGVVNEGTGTAGAIAAGQVAAKTGTAELGQVVENEEGEEEVVEGE
jgi:peptidoglycan glycosyltransferase